MHTERSFNLIDAGYMAAKGLLLWVLLLNPSIMGLAVTATVGSAMAAHYLFDRQSTSMMLMSQENAKDAEQDEHMRAIDRTHDEDEKERDRRRAESLAHRAIQDAEIKELSDTIHNIYGVGTGVSILLTGLHILGLLKKKNGDSK